MSLNDENPSISEELLILASKSNYYKPLQDIQDIEDKFIEKVRLLDPNYKA